MKCSVCGSDINEGDAFCLNCGAQVPKNTGYSQNGYGGQNGYGQQMYGQPNQYQQAPYGQQFGATAPVMTKQRPKPLLQIIIIAVVLVLAGSFYYLRNIITKTVSLGSYSISMPLSMKEQSTSSADSMLSTLSTKGINTEAKYYSNSKMSLSYVSADMSALKAKSSALMSDSALGTAMVSAYKAKMKSKYSTSYVEISSSLDTVEYTFTDSNGKEMYAYDMVKFENYHIVAVAFRSYKKNQSTYQSRFKKYMDTFKLN